MNLKSFLSTLVPHFERNRIIQDIDSLTADVKTNLVPSYESASKLFQGRKFNSDVGKVMESMFHHRFPQERTTTHVAFITEALQTLQQTLEKFEPYVGEVFERDVTRDSLTYKKAAILQFLSVSRFFNDFAGRHLLRLLAAEEAAHKQQPEDTSLLPIDRKYFQENLETFLQAAQVVSMPSARLFERLGQMQDLQIVQDKINSVRAAHGEDEVDPLHLGFMGPSATSSPIYKIRSAIANYQNARHEQNKELIKGLQLRLFTLKDAYANKSDPRLQEQIEYNEKRLSELRESVAAVEERYG